MTLPLGAPWLKRGQRFRRVACSRPIKRRVFVAAEQVAAAFRGAPRMASAHFQRDVDMAIDQDPSQA